MLARKGQCACGEIKYSVTGEPMHTVFCYCKDCQRLTSTDKWFGAFFAKDNFQLTAGSPKIYSRTSDAGNIVNALFCGNCATTIAGELPAINFYSVAVATLLDAGDMQPSIVLYAASAPSWAVFPEGVPSFDAMPPRSDS